MADIKKIKEEIKAKLADRLNDIIPNTPIIDVYNQTIDNMTDTQLESWIQALENGVQDFPDPNKQAVLVTLISPNLDSKNAISVERNLKLAKKMGYDFFERCWITNPVTGQASLTNRRYLSMHLPVRRQAQTLVKKISLPDGASHVDERTGQVTGASKGSSLSYPEIQMLDAQGLDKSIYEMIKIRGGDEEALRLMMRQIVEHGEVNQEQIEQLGSTTKVNLTLKHILNGMHIRNNV